MTGENMPLFDLQAHHRHSIRLKGYDYAQAGAYFVTLVTWQRECLFGEVTAGEMRLNEGGEIVREEWEKSAEIRREVELGAFVVMPNHFHAIVILRNDHAAAIPVGATGRSPLRPNGPKPKSLGALLAGFKSAVTKRINESRNTPGSPIWQRNYYEHIIRNEREMTNIWKYIRVVPK
jgi:REP element-mobilizing transposase RayT